MKFTARENSDLTNEQLEIIDNDLYCIFRLISGQISHLLYDSKEVENYISIPFKMANRKDENDIRTFEIILKRTDSKKEIICPYCYDIKVNNNK